jgi:hypothetical protein
MTRSVIPNRRAADQPTPHPERLTEGQFGRLLRDGNRELADGLDQSAAFQRLTERLSASRSVFDAPRAYWLAPVTVLALLAFAVSPSVARWLRADPAVVIVAEDLHAHPDKRVASSAATAASAPSPAPAITRPADTRSAFDTRRPAHAPSTSLSSVSAPTLPNAAQAAEPQPPSTPPPADSVAALAPTAPVAGSEVGAAPDCLSLARRGQTRDAEACFLKRAEGSGLGAEMALYEVARLRRDVLGDAAGALRVLAEYRTRFPSGSLRREADMSQLELLVQLGRTDEALKQSDELLSSSASGERAAELRLLRGHILRKTRSFAAAAREYELAERVRPGRGDVTYFHALCLEALGLGPEAAALFGQYLEQPQHSYAEDARRRLEKLKP